MLSSSNVALPVPGFSDAYASTEVIQGADLFHYLIQIKAPGKGWLQSSHNAPGPNAAHSIEITTRIQADD